MAPFSPERARITSRSPIDFIAAAVSTSPVVESEHDRGNHGGCDPGSAVAGRDRRREIVIAFDFRFYGLPVCRLSCLRSGVLGERRSLRDESHAERDEHNARPALERNGFVQPEARQQRDDHVAEGRGGQDKGEIGPGERGQVAGEEADQQRDPGGDPGSKDRGDQRAGWASVIAGMRGHAAREATVAERGANGDQAQDQVLARRKCV